MDKKNIQSVIKNEFPKIKTGDIIIYSEDNLHLIPSVEHIDMSKFVIDIDEKIWCGKYEIGSIELSATYKKFLLEDLIFKIYQYGPFKTYQGYGRVKFVDSGGVEFKQHDDEGKEVLGSEYAEGIVVTVG